MSDGGIGSIQAVEFRLETGSDDESGKLPGEEIEGPHSQHHQQDYRNHSNENVGDDQPVAQPPQQAGFQPAGPQDNEEYDSNEGEEADPTIEAGGPSRVKGSQQPLQYEQEPIRRQHVPSH